MEDETAKEDKDRVDVDRAMVYLSKKRKELEIKASKMKVDLDRLHKKLETEKTRSTHRALDRNKLRIKLALAENCAMVVVAKAAEVKAGADKAFGDGYYLAQLHVA